MTISELLNKFGEYTGYDANQKKFNLFSTNYEFHKAGQDIEMLLDGYDPSGALSAMRARAAFIEAAKGCRFNLYELLTKPELQEDVAHDAAMWSMFNDPEVLEETDAYINNMNRIVQSSMGISMIGERDMEQEREAFLSSVLRVVEDLKKLHMDVYQSNGPIGKITKFTTRILIFERMADCLLSLSDRPDAMYLCYIQQRQSPDGYFAFMIKSNGNLIALHDRIDEKYIGQHSHSRNGRWTDRHMDKLFPYDYIFNYEGHDYKGYATKYCIDDSKLDFVRLEADVYQPIIVAMLIFKIKYEGTEVKQEPLLLNTLFQRNYLLEHTSAEETALAIILKNEIAIRSNQYVCGIDVEKAISGSEYNKEFGLGTSIIPWESMYGDGFVPNLDHALASCIGNIKEESECAYYSEFIGTAERMDLQVYYAIRKQLAKYIQTRVNAEYEELGTEGVRNYWYKDIKQHKAKFLNLVFMKAYSDAHPELNYPEKEPLLKRIKMNDACARHENANFNDKVYSTSYHTCPCGAYDDLTGTKCSFYYWFDPNDWRDMESFIGEKLPNLFQGWHFIGSYGNSLLDVTDPVADVFCPIKHYSSFSFCIGFSKTGWNKAYEDWLKVNGHADEIERIAADKKAKKAEKRKENLEKKLLPAQPYQKNAMFEGHPNCEQAEALNQELYSVSPHLKISGIGVSGKNNRIKEVNVIVPVKKNAAVMDKLRSLGWNGSHHMITMNDGSRARLFRHDVPSEKESESQKSE